MHIERRVDEMRTRTTATCSPPVPILSGQVAGMTSSETDYRRGRLAVEAAQERLAEEARHDGPASPRDGLRQHIGHAVMALGHAIHGMEPEPGPRRSLRPR
jgi:hypothetical protein